MTDSDPTLGGILGPLPKQPRHVQVRCAGCDWRASVETLAELSAAAAEHDDSPRQAHIVLLDPPRPWPQTDADFEALASPARDARRIAIDRELQQVRDLAGAPRPPRLGCSTVSHDRIGYCGDCTQPAGGHRLEAMGWQLLALREATDG